MTSQDGGVLSREECLLLAHAEGDDLFGLVVAANELRQRLVGDVISYVVTRNINFTNVCFVGCKFCAFSVGPRDEDRVLPVARRGCDRMPRGREWGATEVCIQGGLPRDLPPFYYRDILRAVKSATPKMHAHAFSPMEMVYGVELTGMPIREYLLMLKENGLDTLPGTAAEILDDDVRHVLSRNKLSIGAVARGHRDGAPVRHSQHLDHDVRPLGDAGALGEPDAAVPRDPVAHRRLHRVRAARLHSRQHAAVRARAVARAAARWRST